MTNQTRGSSPEPSSVDEAATRLLNALNQIVQAWLAELQPLIDWFNRPDVRAVAEAYMAERSRDAAR